MTTIYILIGLPGSGKSTWAKKWVAEHERTVIVNRDAIRTMLKGVYVYSKELELLVKKMLLSALDVAIIMGLDVIVDETHTTKERRTATLNKIKTSNISNVSIKIVYVHCTETERNLLYRMKEDRGLSAGRWASVIDDMKVGFESFEGEQFDELIEVAMP